MAEGSKYMKVLSIDGGGIRGIIPALILTQLEALTGKPVWQQFDLIAGTSTGGILALALTCPAPGSDPPAARYAARDLIDLYANRGKEIFPKKLSFALLDQRYDTDDIEAILLEYYGNARLADALTEVIITSYDIERRRPIVFKRRHARSDLPKRVDHDFEMRQIARATSAAPTYFEPTQLDIEGGRSYFTLVDGGVYANNPALCAYIEALKLKKPDQKMMLVTLGTGQLTHRIPYKEAKDWGLLSWARQIVDIVFDGVSDNVEYLLEHLKNDDDVIFRLQTKLDESTAPLDNADTDNINALRLLGDELANEHERQLDQIAAMLMA